MKDYLNKLMDFDDEIMFCMISFAEKYKKTLICAFIYFIFLSTTASPTLKPIISILLLPIQFWLLKLLLSCLFLSKEDV